MNMMCAIPRLPERVKVMAVRHSFRNDASETARMVDAVSDAAAAVKGSKKLAKVLEKMLALGNHLNRGTNRGEASGFKLDGLIKFTETKGVDQSTTLLTYLCENIMEKTPELLSFPEELKAVGQAAKSSFTALEADCKSLRASLGAVEEEVQHAPPEAELCAFLSSAQQQMSGLEHKLAAMNTGVLDLSLYFGEKGLMKEPETPFRIIDQFASLFVKARHEAEVGQQRKADRDRRAALAAARRSTPKA